MGFHVGQLVYCVDDRCKPGYSRRPGCNYPTKGTIYTVRDIAEGWHGKPLLLLREIDNSHMIGDGWAGETEPGMDAEHFRPITDDKLAIFRQHLAPTPKQTERV